MPSVTRRVRAQTSKTHSEVEQALVGSMERLLETGRSFTAVSVEDLAREAGISRAYFYIHFRDKGELVQRLMKHVTFELIQAAGLWFKSPETANRGDLERAIRGIVEVYSRHRAAVLAIVETSAYDPDVAAGFREMMNFLVDQSRQATKRALQSGKGHPLLLPEVADVLTWMIERCCNQLLVGKDSIEHEKIVQAMIHVAWSSIHPPANAGLVPKKFRKKRTAT